MILWRNLDREMRSGKRMRRSTRCIFRERERKWAFGCLCRCVVLWSIRLSMKIRGLEKPRKLEPF